ncbi:MAG: class I SAM-dependent methyltransferase, partial [Planctomycetes bacterium]|nr:class I SAM-dependent methyltransferase [Planctomycetota bacterium]
MSSQSGLPADASSASFSCTDGTGDYWNNWQDLARGEWVDWGDHPTIRALLQNRLFGSPEIDLFTHLLQSYPEFASASALSLCCGDGSFEKALLQAGVFTHVTGIDIAERRIASAAENDDDRFTCRLGDVNRGAFGTAVYDVVLAKSALHHIQSLEAAFAGMDRCLRPDGYLLTIDYFGPDRLQWTDRQLFEANRFLSEEIPPELRRFGADGQYDQVANTSAEEVIAADPSEAARSSELLGFV